MDKKLCILLIFNKLEVFKLLIYNHRMHNLYAIFAKFLNICKQVAGNLVNESGNVPRRGVVPRFSDLEVVALNRPQNLSVLIVSHCCLPDCRSIEIESPTLYPAGNTMTDVRSLHPCVISCVIE